MSELDKTLLDTNSDTNRPITISVDAMGGDNAPECVFKAIKICLKEFKDIKFKIFGNRKKIDELLDSYRDIKEKCEIIHSEEEIADDEKPSVALRKGRRSSMYMAINAVKNGEADAIVSSGNTGALMAISKILLQTLPGIDRPAIGGIMPSEKDYCVMLDLGANIHCDAENLFEFAVMGSAFARIVLGKENPSVGLLNVGAERNKGHEVLRTALNLIEESDININLYGYVEGDDIHRGTVDVTVTDGFTGNVALKTAEGTSKLYTNILKRCVGKSLFGMLGSVIASPAFLKAKKIMNPKNYNGAMLLGLNGIVIKSHGSTDKYGFANAIKVAHKLVKQNINDQITREMISSGHVPPRNGFEEEVVE
jgi:glycerol-3-phosphate acyltransferase PlsX